MKTSGGNDSILYTLVAGFLRGFIKGLVLTTAVFVIRDVREHRGQDRGKRSNPNPTWSNRQDAKVAKENKGLPRDRSAASPKERNQLK
jgi:hypothetical protein